MIKMAYVYKRNNRWRWRVNRTLNGERKPINSTGGYRLKSQAESAGEKIEEQVKHGIYVEPTDETFDRYYEKWFKTFYKGKKSVANDNHYISALQKIKKYFPDKKISDITRYDYQDFLNQFGADHAPATVLKAHVYISKCFKEAYHFKLISEDPTYQAVLTGNKARKKKEEIKFMDLADFKKLIQYAYTHLDPRRVSNYMILVMANTGMRFEEAAGLTWNCIDFDNQTIKIDKAWNYQKKPADFGATKNRSSNRSVHVDQQTMATLRKLKVINDKRQLLRPDYNPKHLAFIRPETGLPITNDGLNTVLANICGKLDIYPDSEDHKHNYTSHSLRHTHASLLFYEKRDIAYISKRLGHESISTTYKTYVHVIKELSARNDNAIDGIISDLYNQS